MYKEEALFRERINTLADLHGLVKHSDHALGLSVDDVDIRFMPSGMQITGNNYGRLFNFSQIEAAYSAVLQLLFNTSVEWTNTRLFLKKNNIVQYEFAITVNGFINVGRVNPDFMRGLMSKYLPPLVIETVGTVWMSQRLHSPIHSPLRVLGYPQTT